MLRGDNVKDDSGAYAVSTEQGSLASQMTAAKIMDVIARLPGCDGQGADAVSAYTQVKLEDAPKSLIVPKSECPDVWIRLPRHKWPKSWDKFEDPVILLGQILYGHPITGLLWERQFEEALPELGWEKIPNWEWMFVHRKQGLFLSENVDDIKMAGTKQEEIDENLHHFFDHVHLGDVFSVNANRMKQLLNNIRRRLNHEFLLEQQRNYQDGENFTYKPKRGLTTWKDMLKNASSDTVKWQTRK